MQKIIVNMERLKEKVSEIAEDGMSLVELRIIPQQIDSGDVNPSFIHFEGISTEGIYKDYEGMDEASVSECLLVHKSA